MEVSVPREGCKGKAGRKRKKTSKNSPAVQVHWKWRGCWLRTAISLRSQNNKRNTERDCLEEESLCCIFLTAFKLGENRKGGWTDPSISKHVVPAWLRPGCVPGCLQKPREVAYPCPLGMWKLFLDTMCFTGQEKGTKLRKFLLSHLENFFPPSVLPRATISLSPLSFC